MQVQKNQDITKLNTLKLKSITSNFIELSNLNDLSVIGEYLKQEKCCYFILGGGSNLILPEIYDGLVIHNKLTGIAKIVDADDYVIIESMAGEIWDEFVLYTISNGWFGLENLSLIPGTVGASPIQNIGAYGVEVCDFIEYVKIFDISTNSFKQLQSSECNFSYRNSIFKTKPNYIVVSVGFRLVKTPRLNLEYADVARCMKDHSDITPLMLRNCIIGIRQLKLPDPKIIANVGSFFHNPVLSKENAENLKLKYSELPVYTVDKTNVKISAGWLIDKLGLKGYRKGNIAVYEKQALVLVNYGDSTQTELLVFAKFIQDKVKLVYEVSLNIEPIIIGG